MSSLYQRGKNKIWWGKTYIDGETYRESLKTTNKRIARKKLKLWLEELEDRLDGNEDGRVLFDDAVLTYVRDYIPSLKAGTQITYIGYLNNLSDSFEGMYLDQINLAALRKFEQKRRNQGVTSSTIIGDLAGLSSLFGYCEELDLIDDTDNPVPKYRKKRRRAGLRPGEPRKRFLSEEEERILLDHAKSSKNQLLMRYIAFAIDTGMRTEEIFSLKRSQINLQKQEISLGIETKSNKSRIIPILPRQAQFLAQHPRHFSTDYLFYKKNGKRFDNFKTAFNTNAKKAGINDIRPHDLRRTCGCRLLNNGEEMKVVSDWLGHESVRVTEQSYAFLSPNKLHEAARSLAHQKAQF